MSDETNNSGKTDLSKFWNTIRTGVHELVHLQIVTAVGDVTVSIKPPGDQPGDGVDIDKVEIQNSSAIVSRFNLLTGDISTTMDTKFTENGPYNSLLTFHQERETKGEQQIKDNIGVLKEIVKFIWGVENGTFPEESENNEPNQ